MRSVERVGEAHTCSPPHSTMHGDQITVRTRVPTPTSGRSVRLQFGSHELVLESVRGGHALLWSDGRIARRYALGLARDGQLQLEMRAPRLRVDLAIQDTVLLMPRARLRGYVVLPLVPTLVWEAGGACGSVVAELPPKELAAQWQDESGIVFQATSGWHVRFPMRGGGPAAVLPLHLVNRAEGPTTVGRLPIGYGTHQLRERRGVLVLPPRRLVFQQQQWVECPLGNEVALEARR